jgi:DMSO/TMAO reductase YedYZ molybdopterin-dependent catalytic subunit
MTIKKSRRDVLKGTLAAAGLGALGVSNWVLPALAQGTALVPFTDIPDDFAFVTPPDRRRFDIRRIEGPFTPADEFFTVQHYGHPVIETASHRLSVAGLVDRPLSLSIDDLHEMGGTDLAFGFECSGNRGPNQGLSSNGRWTGLPLRTLLDRAGVQDAAQEFVFFGADGAEEEVEWRGRAFTVDVRFGRSLSREKALAPEPFLAWGLNGEPLTRHQGAPLRLLVPGWYGVANVKWLSEIHLQQERYVGKWQARNYRTIKGEMVDGEMRWYETAIGAMKLKSFVARVTRTGSVHTVLGVVLHDGTPLRSVEVRVDDGPWQPAAMDPSTPETYAWKLFTFDWRDATPGEHTLVSRVTDVNGQVQPTEEDLVNKVTFLEHNAQSPRTVLIG